MQMQKNIHVRVKIFHFGACGDTEKPFVCTKAFAKSGVHVIFKAFSLTKLFVENTLTCLCIGHIYNWICTYMYRQTYKYQPLTLLNPHTRVHSIYTHTKTHTRTHACTYRCTYTDTHLIFI